MPLAQMCRTDAGTNRNFLLFHVMDDAMRCELFAFCGSRVFGTVSAESL